MAENIEAEVQAIKTVLNALEPLPPEIRTHVLGYVLTRLKIPVQGIQQLDKAFIAAPRVEQPILAAGGGQPPALVHIKSLKDLKKPRSDSEMAALVAYYLMNVAPEKDRTERLNTKLLETYFKIAEYPLPEKPQFTLPNAKAAGYLDAVGNGEYKLNAVGHNLIVHGLPRGKEGAKPRKKAKAPKKAPRSTHR